MKSKTTNKKVEEESKFELTKKQKNQLFKSFLAAVKDTDLYDIECDYAKVLQGIFTREERDMQDIAIKVYVGDIIKRAVNILKDAKRYGDI